MAAMYSRTPLIVSLLWTSWNMKYNYFMNPILLSADIQRHDRWLLLGSAVWWCIQRISVTIQSSQKCRQFDTTVQSIDQWSLSMCFARRKTLWIPKKWRIFAANDSTRCDIVIVVVIRMFWGLRVSIDFGHIFCIFRITAGAGFLESGNHPLNTPMSGRLQSYIVAVIEHSHIAT